MSGELTAATAAEGGRVSEEAAPAAPAEGGRVSEEAAPKPAAESGRVLKEAAPATAAESGRVAQLSAAIEAILFSSNRPLRLRELQHATDSERPVVEEALAELREALAGRGLMLQRQQDLVGLVTRPEVAAYVRRALRPEVTGRLSPAAYETLAIVAFQQPVTRARIEEIRGGN